MPRWKDRHIAVNAAISPTKIRGSVNQPILYNHNYWFVDGQMKQKQKQKQNH